MANTYAQIYVQVVFAVKGRQSLIEKSWRDELYRYICGIIHAKGQKVYAVGGVADHIHVLISVKPSITIADLVRDIKASSSKWINERGFVSGPFQWQEGFGVFSYARSQLDAVIGYINNQELHHAKQSFKEEYVQFLKDFTVSYDEKYLFDWID